MKICVWTFKEIRYHYKWSEFFIMNFSKKDFLRVLTLSCNQDCEKKYSQASILLSFLIKNCINWLIFHCMQQSFVIFINHLLFVYLYEQLKLLFLLLLLHYKSSVWRDSYTEQREIERENLNEKRCKYGDNDVLFVFCVTSRQSEVTHIWPWVFIIH